MTPLVRRLLDSALAALAVALVTHVVTVVLFSAINGATIEVLARTHSDDVQGLIHPIGEKAPSYLHLRRRHWRNDAPFMVGEVELIPLPDGRRGFRLQRQYN